MFKRWEGVLGRERLFGFGRGEGFNCEFKGRSFFFGRGVVG